MPSHKGEIGKLNYSIGFQVDQQSAAELKQLLTQLSNVGVSSANQKMSPQLKESIAAAQKLKDILSSSWNGKIGQLNLDKVNKQIKDTYENVDTLKQKMVNGGAESAAAFNKFSSTILNTNNQIKQSSQLLDKMALTFANTVRFSIASSVFQNITGSIQKAWDYSIKLDTSLNDIRIVTGKSADEMERFARTANKAAQNLGTSTKDYTDAALIYYQQGLGDAESQKRAEITMKTANVTGQSGRETSEQLTAIWNGYKVTADEAELYIDKVAKVAATSAADLEEMATGMSKVASAANSAGVDIDQLNATLATVISVTREAPETIGSAFKTIYARLGDLSLGKTDEEGVGLGKVSGQLHNLGVEILDQEGNMRDMGDVVEDIAAKWQTWTQAQRQAAAVAMAGKMQYSRLIALFDNWDKYSQYLNDSATAAGTLNEQQSIYLESVEAHLTKLRTEAENTYDILFDTDAVNSMADAMTGLLSIFNDWMSGVGGGLNSLTVLASGLANIFSKQIGAGIANMIQNREVAKNNLAGEELKKNLAASIAQDYQAQGQNITSDSARVQAEADAASRILKIKSQLTQEEYEQLTAVQKRMGEQAELIASLHEYEKVEQDILQIDKATTKDFKDRLTIERQELENAERKNKIKTKELTEQIKSYNKMSEEERGAADLRSLKMKLKLLEETPSTGDAESTAISEARQKILNNEKITQQEIEAIIKAQNDKLIEQKELVNQIERGLEEKQQVEDAKVSQKADEDYLKEIEHQKARQQAIQGVVQGLTSVIYIMTSLSGIIETINDDTLTAEEKTKRVLTTLLAMLPMVIANFGNIMTLIPSLVTAFTGLTTAEFIAAQGATTLGGAIWTALAPILPIILAVAAAIALLTVGIVSLVNAWDADANAAKEARQTAEEAAEAYSKLNEEAEKLKTNISDYSKGIEQLKKLTAGTEEYKDALEDVNAQAKELIETYKLYDDYSYENGIIKLDSNALSRIQKEAQEKAQNALIYKYSTDILATRAENKNAATNLQRRIGTIYNNAGDANQIVRNDKGTTYEKSASDYDINGSRYLSKDSINQLVESINKVRDANRDEYDIISKSDDKFKEIVDTLGETNPAIKSTTEQIIKNKDAFFDLANSTYEAQKSLKYYAEQMTQSLILSKYNDEITAMSFKNGELDSGRAAQIASIMSKMPGATTSQKMLEKAQSLDRSKIKFEGIFGNDTLNDVVQQMIDRGGKELERLRIDNDEDLVRTYAREILGYSSSDVSKMQYKSGWWSRSLTDEKGNKVVDDRDDDYMRKQLYDKAWNEWTSQQAEQQLDVNQILSPLEKALSGAKEYGKRYGTDFSDALLNALDSKTKEFDFSDVFARLDPNEVNEMVVDAFDNQFDGSLLERFGLSEDDVKALGYKDSQEFAQAFVDGLNNWEWDADKAISAAMEAKNEEFDLLGLSKSKLEDYKDTVQDYAKNLMVIAEDSEKLADTLDLDADAAVNVAYAVIKMNKAIDTLADNMEDWEDILKHSAKESQEYAEAAGGIRNALADVYNVESDYISNSFIVDHLEQIKKVAEGDEKAIDGLRDALAEDIIMNIMIHSDIDSATREDVMNTLHQLQTEIPDILIGTSLDINKVEGTEKAFMESMQHIIDAAGLTAEQANALFNTMGFQAAFATEEVPTEQEVPEYVTETTDAGTRTEELPDGTKQTWIKTRTRTYQDGTYKAVGKMTAIAMETSADGTKVPKITSLTKTSNGAINNYSSSNKGGKSPGKSNKKSGGGGGGKESKPSTEKHLEKELDPYHDVNIQLNLLSKQLEKVQKQRDKLFGSKLIDNLNSQLNLLNKQIDLTNEKMRIARSEQDRLGKLLAGRGAIFNPDGTIANYADLYNSELAKVNAVIDHYNSLSKEAQEEYKDTLDKAKEDFSKFEEQLKDYDETVSSIIPELEKDIQDALDKQIEINIEKFNMEIKIRLDMKAAEKDWLDFKKKVIDKVKADDIFKNTKANFAQWKSYYEGDAGNIIQKNTEHITDIIKQLNQINDKGTSEWYGDNKKQALEDLQTYYKELMSELGDMEDLVDEIKQSYLDMMDEAKEKLEDQVALYEQINDIIEHDKKVIELIYGEDSYKDLAKYYEKQHQNNLQNLDFQRKEVDFWKKQMDSAEKGSKQWEKAKENWMDAVSNWNKTIEESITTAKDAWVNAINEVFQKLNNKVTNGLGLDYVTEEWNLINKNADQYLDTINSLYGIQKIQNKYLDALDKTDSISAQRKLNKLMEEEVKALQEKDKLTQYDIDRAERKYQIALKQIALEEAQQNKSTMRLRRDSQGNYSYQFVEDQSETDQLRDELSDLYNQLYNFDLEHYRDNLNQILDTWTEYQEKMAEAAQINDPELRAEREALIQEQYGDLINGLVEQNEVVRLNLHESGFNELADLYHIDRENFQALTDEEKDIMLEQMIPQWDSGVQHMVETFAGEGGFAPTCEQAMNKLNDVTQRYEDKLREVEQAGGVSFDRIRQGTDETIRQTQQLIYDNQELIDKYNNELMAIQNVINQLKVLEAQYDAVKKQAIAATEAAYRYWQLENKEAADAAYNAISGGSGSAEAGSSGSGGGSSSRQRRWRRK